MLRLRVPFVVIALSVTVLMATVAPAGIASAGGGHCRTQAITDGDGVAVEVVGFCYEPTVLRIETGQTVKWTNRDAAPHTVSGVNGAWGDFTEFAEDQSVRFSFSTDGVFPYFCALHPGMIGAVVVGDPDAGTAASGSAGSSMSLLWLTPVVLTSLGAGAFLGAIRRR